VRVLSLRRDRFGGIAATARVAVQALRDAEHDVVDLEASSWIPNATDRATSKEVSAKLRKAAEGFDLVHAWGYRCAWACAEAFGAKRAWVVSLHDFPTTLHPDLIDRLNLARRVLCSSDALRARLDEAWTLHLSTVHPAVLARDTESVEAARYSLGLDPEVPLVVAGGRPGTARGLDALVAAFDRVRQRFPEARLALIGGEHPGADYAPGYVFDVSPWLAAASVCVVPTRLASTSLLGLEAMAMGRPVLFREAGGLPELVVERTSGFLFLDDDSLGDHLGSLLQMPLTLESVGAAARVRAETAFDPGTLAANLAGAYASAVT
jgi:glycosyltransferase involved in cell wall biosynthesis